MRIWLGVTSLALATAALPAAARADVPADSVKLTLKTPESEEVAASDNPTDFSAPTDDVKARQFNRARCECDHSANVTQNVLFDAEWATRPSMPQGVQLFAWVGSDCAGAQSLDARNMQCTALASIPDAVKIDETVHKFERVGELLTPGTTTNAECNPDLKTVTYGLYTSDDGQATLTKVVDYPIDVDMKPPPVPTEVTVHGQEGQISLEWDTITSEASDIKYFQALCMTAGGALAHDAPTNEAQYDTVDSLCGGDPVETVDAATIANDDEQDGAAITSAELGDLAYLDKMYVCGQASGSTASKITLSGLQNGADYIVVLVSMDKAGNPHAVFVPRTVSPASVTDFWEDANAENPDIQGGLCLIESTYGGGDGGLNGPLRAWRDDLSQTSIGRWFVAKYYAWGAPLAAAAQKNVVARAVLAIVMLPLVALALVWHAIGLPAILAIALALVWLRRRRKLVIAAAIMLAPTLAAAQSMTPYWDDDVAASDAEEATGPKYHFGIRLGPYTPSIDTAFMSDPGPYERMFGDGSWMPTLDLHRVFTTRFGQLGAGLSVGYFGKTADAYIPNTDPPIRAEGNENSLKIIPFEATAIYRATQLHDDYRIPLVPYLRGGLGYYLWWVRRPDGEFAKACPADMTNCDRAIGASLGLVGAVGLAIRAEGIDPSAARSMRDSGLDHAGFYGELEMGWVDGFGSAKKLSLGDTTWSAGIDFEF